MEQRPNNIVGLTVHALKVKWAGLDRTRKLALAGVVLAFALAIGMWGGTMMAGGSCPSGGCPYSGAGAASPCSH